MIQMRTENTSGGTTMSDLEIMRHVIGGKQRGHIPGIGPVLPGCNNSHFQVTIHFHYSRLLFNPDTHTTF